MRVWSDAGREGDLPYDGPTDRWNTGSCHSRRTRSPATSPGVYLVEVDARCGADENILDNFLGRGPLAPLELSRCAALTRGKSRCYARFRSLRPPSAMAHHYLVVSDLHWPTSRITMTLEAHKSSRYLFDRELGELPAALRLAARRRGPADPGAKRRHLRLRTW